MAALIVTLAAMPVAAHGPDPILGSSLWAQDQSVVYRWRSGAEPPAALKTAIRDAADDSNATRASRAAIYTYGASGTSLVGYGTGTCGVNGIGCFTRSAPDSFTMWLREHGRVFDWGTLRWCQMMTNPANGCYDAETIALDEFGHVEGLNHHLNYADDRDYTDAVVQTYSRTRPSAGFDMHRYGVCDIATLQIRYDIPKASSPYSTCLDLVTILTLGVNDAAIPYGAAVTFKSVLKVASDADYGRLAGNGVSSRTVRLQRRAIGATSWVTIATLAQTTSAGTYSATMGLTDTADFRAVFTASSSEGLVGDTSPIVRVTVAPCSPAQCPLPIIGV
jgi:hypothetical protein